VVLPGTGKTLTLILKLLHELYEWRERGESPRILFVTHSWSMASQADSMLHELDESGNLSAVDVFPLLEIARSVARTADEQGIPILGQDQP